MTVQLDPVHHVNFEISSQFGMDVTFTCTAVEDELCRLVSGCECEVYIDVRQREDGTWIHTAEHDDEVSHEMSGGRQDCNVLDWLQSAEWYETYGGPDGATPKNGLIHVGWANEDDGYVWWLDGTERVS